MGDAVMEEVRRKIQGLQGRLDEEGDNRERVARYHAVLDINQRIGGGEGLMQELGYRTSDTAQQISRTRQQQANRSLSHEYGTDPLDTAKMRTEKLQTRLSAEDTTRQSLSEQAVLRNMEMARSQVMQKANQDEQSRIARQVEGRRKKEDYLKSIEGVACHTRNDLLTQERVMASNNAKARREAAAREEERLASETPGHKEERATRKAHLGDELMSKLDSGIQRLEAEIQFAQEQQQANQSTAPATTGTATPSTLHDTTVAGESCSSYWAGRVEDSKVQ